MWPKDNQTSAVLFKVSTHAITIFCCYITPQSNAFQFNLIYTNIIPRVRWIKTFKIRREQHKSPIARWGLHVFPQPQQFPSQSPPISTEQQEELAIYAHWERCHRIYRNLEGSIIVPSSNHIKVHHVLLVFRDIRSCSILVNRHMTSKSTSPHTISHSCLSYASSMCSCKWYKLFRHA